MAVEVNPVMRIGGSVTVTLDGLGSRQFTINEYDRATGKYSSTSTPPVTKWGTDELAMTGSAVNLDLTAVPNPVEGAQSFSGLKIVFAHFQNPGANIITVDIGGSNGYAINGADGFIIQPGGVLSIDFKDGLSDVDGTHKILDITGTAADVLNYVLFAG